MKNYGEWRFLQKRLWDSKFTVFNTAVGKVDRAEKSLVKKFQI